MPPEKITISWDDLRSPPEPTKAAAPAASAPRESWGRVDAAATAPTGTSSSSRRRPLVHRAWFYLGVAGLVAGVLGWGLSETLLPDESESSQNALLGRIIATLRTQTGFSQLPVDQRWELVLAEYAHLLRLRTGCWMALIGGLLGAGLASAEGVVSRSIPQAIRGMAVGLLTGAGGGFLGGLAAQWLYNALLPQTPLPEGAWSFGVVAARSAGWALAGAAVGSSVGLSWLSPKKTGLGAAGGLLGGWLGGLLFDGAAMLTQSAVVSRFVGILAIGAASGVLISLAELAARRAWVQVEAGRLIGKQFLIYRSPTRLGSRPANEIYLFKDRAVEPLHAQIERRGSGYALVHQAAAGRTLLNGQAIRTAPLRDGDKIQLGETVLRYSERRTP